MKMQKRSARAIGAPALVLVAAPGMAWGSVTYWGEMRIVLGK